MRHWQRLAGPAVAAACVLAGSACAAPGPSGAGAAGGADGSGLEGTVTVFAAASLHSVFSGLADEFEAGHPGVDVRLNSGGSSDLAAQILAGAPADVFAAADQATMDLVAGHGLNDGPPVVFATNVLQIAVPAANPAGVSSLDDLAEPGVKTVLCAPQVPCGAAASAVQRAAGVDIPAVSEEQSVTDVLGKVLSGQADAGLVYATDVQGAGGKARGISIPEAGQAVNAYPIVGLKGADNPAAAEAFVDLVTGDTGRRALAATGFGPP